MTDTASISQLSSELKERSLQQVKGKPFSLAAKIGMQILTKNVRAKEAQLIR